MLRIVALDGFTVTGCGANDVDWRPFDGLGELVVYDRTPAEQVGERLRSANATLINKIVIGRETLATLPQLRYIGVTATGTNIVDLAAAKERGVVVTNVPAYSTDSVAQHTFALLLELMNRIGEHDRAVHDGAWTRAQDFAFTLPGRPLVELAGKTLGIIGLGSIGRRVAAIGAALGMRVIAAQRQAVSLAITSSSANPETGIGIRVYQDEVFTQSDVLTLHCPLTDATRRIVNQERLSRMKPTAVIINTSRGGLIDESALADALRAGRIGGAAVDVLDTEPPTADNPLLSAPNCVITPHVAWATIEARRRLMEMAADNLRAFAAGNPINMVNP